MLARLGYANSYKITEDEIEIYKQIEISFNKIEEKQMKSKVKNGKSN